MSVCHFNLNTWLVKCVGSFYKNIKQEVGKDVLSGEVRERATTDSCGADPFPSLAQVLNVVSSLQLESPFPPSIFLPLPA